MSQNASRGPASSVGLETVAVLRYVPGATFEFTLYVTTSCAVAPLASVPIVHVNGSAPTTGSVPGPENPVVTNPAGRSSTTTTLWASLGPVFATVIVYV